MKIMGRVARLILLVVVGSSCWLLCLCMLCFVNYELCILAGFFVDQITTGKNYDRKKRGRCAIIITTGKKRSSRLSGGCAIVITTGKIKVLVVCLAGARSLLRPEKKKF